VITAALKLDGMSKPARAAAGFLRQYAVLPAVTPEMKKPFQAAAPPAAIPPRFLSLRHCRGKKSPPDRSPCGFTFFPSALLSAFVQFCCLRCPVNRKKSGKGRAAYSRKFLRRFCSPLHFPQTIPVSVTQTYTVTVPPFLSRVKAVFLLSHSIS
jgi:hypothetical protein